MTNCATGHADVCVNAAMADANDDDNDDNADDGDFADTQGEILGTSFMVSPTLDLDDASGAVDSTVDSLHTPTPPLLLHLLLLGSPPEIQEF